MLRKLDEGKALRTVAIFPELERDPKLLHGLVNASSWRCGHLIDDCWPISPDGVRAGEGREKGLRISEALRPMLWASPQPRLALAAL